MTPILVAAAVAAAAASQPQQAAPQAVEQIVVVTRAPVVGTLQEGVQAYRQEFFTSVRPGTALDMVQWLPGFTFEDVRDVRGLGGAVGNVLIDGQPPTSKTDTLSTVLRRIPASQVDRVDIIVGGAPGIDMRGRSVIANVVLKKTTAPRGSVTVQTMMMDDGRLAPELVATLSRKTDTRTTEGSLTLARRLVQGNGVGTGPLVRTDATGAVLFAARSRIAGRFPFATGTAAHEFPMAGGKLRFNGAFTYIDGKATESTTVAGQPSLFATTLTEQTGQGEIGLRYTRPFGRSTLEAQVLERINAHAASNDTLRPPLVSDLVVNDTLRETVARATWRFKRDDRLTLEGSAEGALNALDTRSDLMLAGIPTRLPTGDVDIRERRFELGTLATWKPSADIGLTGALRLESSNLTARRDVTLERDLTYLKPRLLFSWTVDKKTQVRLRVEREVGQIAFSNFVAAVEVGSGLVRAGNPDLRPRRAWVAEAVLERQFWTGASVVLTARRQQIEDVVDLAPLPRFGGALGVTNIGDAVQTDLLATVTLPLKRLGLDGMNLKGTAGYTDSEVTDPTTGQLRRLSGSKVRGDAHFIHDLPRWKLTWGVDAVYFGEGRLYRPTTLETFEAFLRLSAFVEYRVKSDVTLRLEGFNLTNPRPRWIDEAYAGPRNTAPLVFTDVRANAEGRGVMLRLRKTLN